MVVPDRADEETSTFEEAELSRYRSTITEALDEEEHTSCPSP